MNTTATNKKLRELLNNVRNGILVPNPDFQRRLVWTNTHKLNLIETVLNGYPFPEIFVAAGAVDPDTGVGFEYLVDGQQRITTLYQYFSNSPDLNLGRNVVPYANLSDEDKGKFLEYVVVIRDLGKVSREEIIRVFEKINSTNYSLNPLEIQTARYNGAIKQFAERLSQLEFFEAHRVFNAQDIRRMNDLRFVLWLVITMLSTYFDRDDEVETYLIEYNDQFPHAEKTESEFMSIVSFIERCDFENSSRVWNKADLFTLFVELHSVLFKLKVNIDPKIAGKSLAAFYAAVDEVDLSSSRGADEILVAYLNATQQGSNNRKARILRGEIIKPVIFLGEKKLGKD